MKQPNDRNDLYWPIELAEFRNNPLEILQDGLDHRL